MMGYLHFLHDLFVPLSKLSKELQNAEASIYSCHSLLEASLMSLKSMINRYNHHLTNVRIFYSLLYIKCQVDKPILL